ncbi:hypothetical protein ACOSP7_004380 [Xanthoceras sorbifolium]
MTIDIGIDSNLCSVFQSPPLPSIWVPPVTKKTFDDHDDHHEVLQDQYLQVAPTRSLSYTWPDSCMSKRKPSKWGEILLAIAQRKASPRLPVLGILVLSCCLTDLLELNKVSEMSSVKKVVESS